MVHQTGVEDIDTGGHGRVRREDVAGARRFQCLFEAEVLVAHQQANLFQRQEGRVAFVHVEHRGSQAHSLQGAHAADSQHDLLADARVDIAAVQRIGDIAILRQNILGNVGVQQVQRDAAHAQLPHLDEDVAGGQLDRDLQILAFGIFYREERQRVEIVDRVAFLLPSVGIQKLAEIALLIKQAKADQADSPDRSTTSNDRRRECPGRRNKPAGIQ